MSDKWQDTRVHNVLKEGGLLDSGDVIWFSSPGIYRSELLEVQIRLSTPSSYSEIKGKLGNLNGGRDFLCEIVKHPYRNDTLGYAKFTVIFYSDDTWMIL